MSKREMIGRNPEDKETSDTADKGGERERGESGAEKYKYKDAAEFIRANKDIRVPAAEVPDKLREKVGKGSIGNRTLNFIDKDGNIATVNFDYPTIASIGESDDWKKQVEKVVEELKGYGFDIETEASGPIFREIAGAVEKYLDKNRPPEPPRQKPEKKIFEF